MKSTLLVLFLFFQLNTFASQIVTGLTTKNLIVWNVWEYKKGSLKHYLYLYSMSEKEIKVEIKLKRYKGIGIDHLDQKVNKTFYSVKLKEGELRKLAYPEQSGALNFMNFVEDGKEVGLLGFNMSVPEKSFLDDNYKYYSHEGCNGTVAGFWMRFESIGQHNKNIGIRADFQNEREVVLVKIVENIEEGEPYWAKLRTLQATDSSISKLEPTNNTKTLPLRVELGQERVSFIAILSERLHEGGKMVMAQFTRIPIYRINE